MISSGGCVSALHVSLHQYNTSVYANIGHVHIHFHGVRSITFRL
jgi:hypothetical protein